MNKHRGFGLIGVALVLFFSPAATQCSGIEDEQNEQRLIQWISEIPQMEDAEPFPKAIPYANGQRTLIGRDLVSELYLDYPKANQATLRIHIWNFGDEAWCVPLVSLTYGLRVYAAGKIVTSNRLPARFLPSKTKQIRQCILPQGGARYEINLTEHYGHTQLDGDFFVFLRLPFTPKVIKPACETSSGAQGNPGTSPINCKQTDVLLSAWGTLSQ